MNLLQIVQRLKRESGRSTGATPSPASFAVATADDMRLVDWSIDAWVEILREPYWWKFRRVSPTPADMIIGQVRYNHAELGAPAVVWKLKRPSNYYSPTYYEVGNEAGESFLEFLEYDEFRARYMVGVVPNAQPKHWSISPAEEMLVGPGPDKAYKLRFDYYSVGTTLVASDDETTTPDLPVDFHTLIVWRALMDVATFDAAPEVYTRAMNNYTKGLNALINDQAEDLGFELGSLA